MRFSILFAILTSSLIAAPIPPTVMSQFVEYKNLRDAESASLRQALTIRSNVIEDYKTEVIRLTNELRRSYKDQEATVSRAKWSEIRAFVVEVVVVIFASIIVGKQALK